MTEHRVAQTINEDREHIVVCTCGHRSKHRDAIGANNEHEYHAGLANARLALRGGRSA